MNLALAKRWMTSTVKSPRSEENRNGCRSDVDDVVTEQNASKRGSTAANSTFGVHFMAASAGGSQGRYNVRSLLLTDAAYGASTAMRLPYG